MKHAIYALGVVSLTYAASGISAYHAAAVFGIGCVMWVIFIRIYEDFEKDGKQENESK